jgi:hypothetical protein
LRHAGKSKLEKELRGLPPKEFYVPYVGYPNNNKVWVPKERNVPVSLEEQGQIKDPMAMERLKENK